MRRLLFICALLCMGIYDVNAQSIVDLFRKETTEDLRNRLNNTCDSLRRVCYKYRLDESKYEIPTINFGQMRPPQSYADSRRVLKVKAEKIEQAKVKIKEDIIKSSIMKKRADSIRIVQKELENRRNDSLYMVRAAKTWEWLYDKKGEWKEVNLSYPKEEHYKVNSLFPQYHVIHQDAYLDGTLVAVCTPGKREVGSYEVSEMLGEIKNFLCQQDFINNKYDVKKESPRTVEYIKSKLGLPTKSASDPVLTTAVKVSAAQEKLRKGAIDRDAYKKLETKYKAQAINEISQEMAASDVAKRYIDQLYRDNAPLMASYAMQRIDGTNFTFQFYDDDEKETFSVKVSYYLDEKGEVKHTISSL